MTTKKLWILVIILVILYLLTQYINNYDLETTDFFDAIIFGIDVYGFLLVAFVISILLGVLAAIIPFRQKTFAEKFKVTFPLLTSIVLLIWVVLFAYLGYLKQVKGVERHPLRKYSDINVSKSLDCSAVKNGKFEIENILIERKANRQTQMNTKTGERQEFSVEWMGGCEYILTPLTGNKDNLRVKITSVNPDSYGCYVISGDDSDKYAKHYRVKRVGEVD